MNKPKVFFCEKVYYNPDQASEHICQNGLSLLSLTQAVIGGSSTSQSDVIGYHHQVNYNCTPCSWYHS